ncbi:MAG TPA: ester cyclase [Alphaproteobacteria bacterium]|jgi:predicted ester cyclase|nr:ester cyclase [Alphaproteobacteria bacterium]
MTPSEIFRNWFAEIWNDKRSDLMAKFVAEHTKFHSVSLDTQPVHGPAGFQPLYDTLVTAFPDIRFTVLNVIESGDYAAGHWTATMTHTGEGMGAQPTGQKIDIAGMAILRCADGKAVEVWDQWDRLSLLTRIGAVVPATPS